ncbi:uncharacterized protein LOC118433765 isoform X1 [Folsomia candida]|uniref:uncharacterized protein LOC110861851 isoform X1 n=1 Tax=Folsomia candida TaxID=158441 RepID=UPI001604A6F9|nr:uncharacterized protein LOC110861851 isoform X1 [Folsomia candida]XP_035701887.1 uncharacterized protein LOC118433765 isoform X1 [Folsomia candida]
MNKRQIFSNRSAVCLAYECLQQAILWAEEGLKLDGTNEKCHYRKVKALLGLGHHEQAVQVLTDILKKFGEDASAEKLKEFEKLMKLAQGRASSASLTKSQLMAFIPQQKSSIDTTLLPLIEDGPFTLTNVADKGRGVHATHDIPAGTPLLCTRAFGYFTQNSIPSELYLSHNFDSKSAYMKPGHDQIVAQIANKIRMEPSLGKVIYALTAGKDLGHLNQDHGHISCLDMKRIDRIVSINWFGTDELEEGDRQYSGIWVMPSFFNHSCSEANVVWYVYENYMVMRTTTQVKKGDEMLVHYINPGRDFEKRVNCFKAHEFLCTCHLCRLDSEESALVKNRRTEIMKQVHNWSKKDYLVDPAKIGKSLKLIKILEDLSKSNPTYNTCLLHNSIKILCESLYGVGQYERCAYLLQSCLRVADRVGDGVYGFILRINLIRCHMEIIVDQHIFELKKQVDILKSEALRLFGCLEAISVFGEETVMDLKRFGIEIFE